jgi:hypothetical protein
MLPERTVVLVRMRDVPDAISRFKQISLGRMLQDEQVGPLLSKLYAQAQEAYARVEAEVGVPLERILAIPGGEAWFAVVPSQSEGPVALALLLDAHDAQLTVNQLLERGEKLWEENGGTKLVETIDNTRVNVFVPAGEEGPQLTTRQDASGAAIEVKVTSPGTLVQFEREGTYVVTSTLELAQELLKNWNGKEGPVLSGNDRYATVMSRCTTGEDPPSLEWYVDPLTLAKYTLRGNVGAQTALTLLPAIGLDGLQAIGGTNTWSSGEFDEVQHLHVLLENPPSGVLDLLALRPGEASPENFIPADVTSYMSLDWDLQKTYTGGTKLYDSFFGEGKAKEELSRRVREAIDLDLESEVLASFTGRVTLATWLEPPARFNSQCNLVALQLVDSSAFAPLLERMVAKGGERIATKQVGKTTIYQFAPPERPNRRPPPEFIGALRQPEPCGAVVGDYLLIADSLAYLEHALAAISNGRTLSEELDYKIIQSKLTRLTGGRPSGMLIFSRPAETLENLYTFATSKSSLEALAKQGDENEFFRRLHESLQAHPLPPFAALAKYFAPSGGLIMQDESGFHYTEIQLRRK